MICLAGPGAGFLLAFLVALLLSISGHGVSVEWLAGFFPYVHVLDKVGSPLLTDFIRSLLLVSVFWGAVNLLPIYPLDGGQIAREIIMRLNVREGMQLSLVISLVAAGAMALVSFFKFDDTFMGIFFSILPSLAICRLEAGWEEDKFLLRV